MTKTNSTTHEQHSPQLMEHGEANSLAADLVALRMRFCVLTDAPRCATIANQMMKNKGFVAHCATMRSSERFLSREGEMVGLACAAGGRSLEVREINAISRGL